MKIKVNTRKSARKKNRKHDLHPEADEALYYLGMYLAKLTHGVVS
jgi:hypothetical protein